MPPTTEAKDSRRSSRDRSAAERLSVGADSDRQGSRAGPSRCASGVEVLAHEQATPIRRASNTTECFLLRSCDLFQRSIILARDSPLRLLQPDLLQLRCD